MLGLPKTTEFNKRIPKQKFYENLPVTPVLKRAFVEQIRTIWWRNKIAAATVNLAPGEAVTEIEVLELRLNQPSLDESVLLQIDREIPYYILFLLEYEGKYQAWIGYKEAASGSSAFKVSQYYHTDWIESDQLPLRMEGHSLDAVYENFVRQCRGSVECEEWSVELSVAENVERDLRRQQLQKQITALENKIRKEKQLNRQVEINVNIKKLKRELEML
ncbi:DUF4391 domain-containing protein [Pseudoflavonifractor phocaeensis]|uniref:DUF4391 domain-containing protein n=1 Tax=Pseudoflavonifractor phocaeensis TaxID=1870988 RepID=UPI001958ECBF|nr:DUF4391 domain-containing protein [Pseudoflavonifractor phocaeensis]